jgi:type IV pilus assembly protein PilW
MTVSWVTPTCAKRKSGGFSLVELMVALAIGLFLVIGLISLLVSISHTRTELDKTSRQIENGRYALQLLTADVQHAGFMGWYTPKSATSTLPADVCAPSGGDFVATPSVSVPVFIYGYTGSASSPSCLSNRLAGTAILVVRRVSTTAIPVGSAVAGETYMQVAACAPLNPPFVVSSNSGDFTLKQKDCGTAATIRKYIVRLYYISSCNVCSPSDNIPTLKMAEFVNGAMTITPLAEGIQNLQIDYGVDTNNDGAPDCNVSNPGDTTQTVCSPYDWTVAATNWANVVAMRIYVLARNNEATADWTDTRTYDLGLAGSYTPASGDKYKRHVYGAVVRVVNVASRREQP